ncbi:phage shock protein B [Halioglobus japonicus]|uniref:Envelope stress response membrane protein PspB n=1 Tax=Halioglobus japonicus TaxID=930805 RepID=A0AAP8MHG3_9GAMM|nr:envelope stress response membrane protein PspB [Halioglobus japonicus]AQA19051.1 phage shock protein B [Halioglobus japonicus]PLW87925.1 envelope stress response membrane protein PspB [Halioglobus japonicus]GHD20117.1 phage shock protein B [Halioglobus japonicus]
MEFWQFMFVPTILFMVIVAPVWISMHYRSVNRSAKGLSAEDRETVEQMLETVDKLTDRIETLERLLDADHGGWRQPSGQEQHREVNS